MLGLRRLTELLAKYHPLLRQAATDLDQQQDQQPALTAYMYVEPNTARSPFIGHSSLARDEED